ncbi:hypothetical protein ACFL1N_07515 [Thermodesulfobacteriota bacterium]
MLSSKVKKILIVLIVIIAAGIMTVLWYSPDIEEIHGTSITVSGIKQAKNGMWQVSRSAVASDSESTDTYVLRLKHLRAEKVNARISKVTGSKSLLSSRHLKPGDLLIENPAIFLNGQAVLPVSGVDDSRMINLIIQASIAAVTERKRGDLFRFISTEYRDRLGYNREIMGRFVYRIFDELKSLSVYLSDDPEIFIEGKSAKATLKLRIKALYMGRQNYILGDSENPNKVTIFFRKSENAWKVVSTDGFRPLGFDEKYLRLLGARFDLPLTDKEKLERDERCMPCRQRMSERFGPYDDCSSCHELRNIVE